MKKLIIRLSLLLCTSCSFWNYHIKQAPYAYCTVDGTVSYQISNVKSVKQVSIQPKIYELTYLNDEKEQFFGSCFVPQ